MKKKNNFNMKVIRKEEYDIQSIIISFILLIFFGVIISFTISFLPLILVYYYITNYILYIQYVWGIVFISTFITIYIFYNASLLDMEVILKTKYNAYLIIDQKGLLYYIKLK